MAITINSGQKQVGGIIAAPCGITWSDLSATSNGYGTWSSWTNWNPQPGTISITILEDAGSLNTRLPLLDYEYQGDITVTLKISDQEDSNGLVSPTTYNLVDGVAQTVAAARYYEYTITVAPDSNTIYPYIIEPLITLEETRVDQYLERIDTSTLSGTIDSRQIPTTIGSVTAIIVTAQQEGVTYSSGLLQDRVYAIPDDYVFQENAIIVNTVSLNPPSIRCFDLNGESIDAIVDIIIRGSDSIIMTPNGIEST